MSEPTKDRLPTEGDADRLGRVEVWQAGEKEWVRRTYKNVVSGMWWRQVDQTPPPKPKRDSLFIKDGAASSFDVMGSVEYVRVLPGDPPDWDEFLEAFDDWWEAIQNGNDVMQRRVRMMKARGGE